MSGESEFKDSIREGFNLPGDLLHRGRTYQLERLYRIVLGRPYDRDDNVRNCWAYDLLSEFERAHPSECAIAWRRQVLAETVASRCMSQDRFQIYRDGQEYTIELIKAEMENQP